MKILTDKKFKAEVQKAAQEIPSMFSVRDIFSNYGRKYINTKVSFEDAFSNLCFAIIWRRARVLANSNSILYLSNKAADSNNWLYQLFDGKANVNTDWRTTKRLLSMWLDYYGNAYLYTPVKGSYPNQAWVLPACFVKPQINNGIIDKFKIEYNSSKFFLDAKEVCYFKTVKPDVSNWNNNFFEGQPLLLQASAISVGADKELIEYVQSYFVRDATSPFVLTTPNTMSDPEYQRFRERWDDKLSNYKLAALLEGGLSVEPLSGTSNTANMGTLQNTDDTIITRLGNIWGIAPALITSNFNARATMEVLKQEFYEDTIDPLLTDFEDTLTDHFRQWDSRIYFAHQKLGYTDPDTIFKNKIELYKAGILSRNEIRIAQGLDPIENGDVFLLTNGVNTFENITAIPEPVISLPPVKSVKMLSEIKAIDYLHYKWMDIPEEFKTYFWKKFDKISKKHKKDIQESTASAFRKIYDSMNLNIWYDNLKSIKGKIDTDIDFDFLDIEEWENTLTSEVSPAIRALIIEVLETSLAEIDIDFDENTFKEKIRKMLKNSTNKIKISANTAAEEVGTLIKSIIDENPLLSKSDLMGKINDGVGNRFNDIYTKSRAELIAQTTTTYSTGLAQTSAWMGEGFNTAWLSMRDLKTRGAHADADGQLRGEIVEGMFVVDGLECEFPGDTGDAGNDINCRCSQFPVEEGV